MNCPARDIVTILEGSEAGIGTFEQTLFISREPTSPDNCITVYDTGGFDPEVGYDYQRPTVQVRCRNKSYEAGWTLLDEVKSILHGLNNEVVGGARYIGIWTMSDITCIGYDTNNRALFTINFRIHRTSHP